MMSSIQSMLEHYQPKTAEAYRNALKEIVQEIALYGMSKSQSTSTTTSRWPSAEASVSG